MLLPTVGAARYDVLQWLFFQTDSVGPMSGQFNRFRQRRPHDEYAFARFRDEVLRLHGVMNGTLAGQAFIAGDYSIADIALAPWIRALGRWGVALDDFPEVTRWHRSVMERPAVKAGFRKLET